MKKRVVDRIKIVLRLQYFVYFGAMGVFLPYFNLYCYHIGLDGFEIGAISGLRSVLFIIFPLLWGALADRFSIRRPIYILCAALSSIFFSFYLFFDTFWPMMAVTFFYSIFYSPIISFLESFTMEALGKERTGYGRMRVWGSVSFIAVVILSGRIIDLYSIEIALHLILSGMLILAAISVAVPGGSVLKPGSERRPKGLFTERFIIFLLCAFLMLVSHGAYYAFLSIHLDELGFDKSFIGLAWAVASVAEIVIMLNSKRIFARFDVENILKATFFIAAARWFLLTFARNGAFILCVQLLHAFTYGAFHMASILYIDQLSPQSSKTFGQAANNAITYGFGLMVGFFVSGYFYDRLGAPGLFAASGWVAIAGGLIFSIRGRFKLLNFL